jgi:hypothetical protein
MMKHCDATAKNLRQEELGKALSYFPGISAASATIRSIEQTRHAVEI